MEGWETVLLSLAGRALAALPASPYQPRCAAPRRCDSTRGGGGRRRTIALDCRPTQIGHSDQEVDRQRGDRKSAIILT